ncbi:hypothetical protein D3C86_2135020 [compost metagenome]
MQKGDGQRQAPLHSSGVLIHAFAQMLLQAHQFHDVCNPPCAVSAFKTIEGGEKLQIFLRAQLCV